MRTDEVGDWDGRPRPPPNALSSHVNYELCLPSVPHGQSAPLRRIMIAPAHEPRQRLPRCSQLRPRGQQLTEYDGRRSNTRWRS